MIDIKKAHPYVIALYHAILAENKDWDLITDELQLQYPVSKVIPLENETDRAYIIDTPTNLILSISGTKSIKGWIRNFDCKIDHGWHTGYCESFDNLIKNPLINNLSTKKIMIYGHSAGSAIALVTAYKLRLLFQRTCEAITFCGPQAVTPMGRRACKQNKVCMTTLNIGHHDIVDNITKIIGGVNYGKIVMLPDVGDPSINPSLFLDKIFMGHTPSYVCKALKELMRIYRQPQDDYIDYISTFAEI